MHSFQSQHVPALDGIRGIAIILVIIHHQLVPFSLSGGFLGVDLFFALSGFLITGLLVKEFTANESISLTNFYARRALRLAPAFLIYLLVALIVTLQLHPEEFGRELKLVGLSLVYLTNWRMAFGWDYTLDPTAIIWSLSIEEQFYLLWPPLLLILLTARIKLSQIAIGLSVIVIAVALHRANLWSQGAELNRMYYGTDTRADALLSGCVFALLAHLQVPARLRSALHLLKLLAGAFLVYQISTATFTSDFLYRGAYTLIALASGLLIWGVNDAQDSWFARMFACFPLRWFGMISYGLYLWHWLLLRSASFYHVAGQWDPWMRFVCAVGIAAASFYLVERRVNRLKTRFTCNQSRPLPGSTRVVVPLIHASEQKT